MESERVRVYADPRMAKDDKDFFVCIGVEQHDALIRLARAAKAFAEERRCYWGLEEGEQGAATSGDEDHFLRCTEAIELVEDDDA